MIIIIVVIIIPLFIETLDFFFIYLFKAFIIDKRERLLSVWNLSTSNYAVSSIKGFWTQTSEAFLREVMGYGWIFPIGSFCLMTCYCNSQSGERGLMITVIRQHWIDVFPLATIMEWKTAQKIKWQVMNGWCKSYKSVLCSWFKNNFKKKVKLSDA